MQTISAEEESRQFMQKVYAWMFIGLLVSGITSFMTASTGFVLVILFNKLLFYGLLILEIILVITLAGLVKRISANMAILLFLLYSFTTGLTFSIIFLAYTMSSIFLVFLITAGMFGAMSIFGYITKKDLTGMGQILMMALFGLIIAMIANMFMNNSAFDYILSIIAVIIFTGLTAYDTQKIKETNIIGNAGTDEDKKEAIMGALKLYLDFINLFLNLLRLLGRRR